MSEQKLWRAVLVASAEDALANKKSRYTENAAYLYRWSKTKDCYLVCLYSNIDYDCVAKKFKDIYDKHNM